MRLGDITANVDFKRLVNFRDVEVRRLECDSRKVKPGSLFVCVSGFNTDGHAYADGAVRNGAVAVLSGRRLRLPAGVPQIVVEDPRRALSRLAHEFAGRPSESLTVFGTTGTNGKTSVTWMQRSILAALGYGVGVLGTVEYDLGDGPIEADRTTPDSLDLHRYLARMKANGLTHAVIEASSHALVLDRVRDVRFCVATFTNLSREHLDFHGTMQSYRDAKSLLFRGLGADAVAVLNADDPASEHYRRVTKARVVTYGLHTQADFTAENLRVSLDGMRFTLRLPGTEVTVETGLIGEPNCLNALAAAASCWVGTALERQANKNKGGLSSAAEKIRWGLEGLPGVPGRLQKVCGGRGEPYVLIDYAHTPHALECVLKTLRPLVTRGRLMTVFGAGGNRDRGKRPKMARQVEAHADLFWVTSDNPRDEEPMEIIREILSGVSQSDRCRVQPDRELAIVEAVAEAGPDDVLLIAGKGHEKSQTIRGVDHPFDDVEVSGRVVRGVLHRLESEEKQAQPSLELQQRKAS